MFGLREILAAGVLVLAMTGMSAHACERAPARDVYTVKHERFGEVGRHVVTFSCEGDDLVVETKVEGEATILSVPVYTLSSTYREVWRDDRLISFESRVNDNGEKFEVSAHLEGDHMLIDRRRGLIEAPATIISDHPWNHDVIDRPLLFDARRGKLRHVQVERRGEETIEIGGKQVRAKKYVMTGDLERVLWYGEDGTWLQSELDYAGGKVFVTRKQP